MTKTLICIPVAIHQLRKCNSQLFLWAEPFFPEPKIFSFLFKLIKMVKTKCYFFSEWFWMPHDRRSLSKRYIRMLKKKSSFFSISFLFLQNLLLDSLELLKLFKFWLLIASFVCEWVQLLFFFNLWRRERLNIYKTIVRKLFLKFKVWWPFLFFFLNFINYSIPIKWHWRYFGSWEFKF